MQVEAAIYGGYERQWRSNAIMLHGMNAWGFYDASDHETVETSVVVSDGIEISTNELASNRYRK